MEHKNYCNPEMARAFFKIQKFNEIFRPQEGLQKGTIFPELYCPYKPAHHQHKDGKPKRWEE